MQNPTFRIPDAGGNGLDKIRQNVYYISKLSIIIGGYER